MESTIKNDSLLFDCFLTYKKRRNITIFILFIVIIIFLLVYPGAVADKIRWCILPYFNSNYSFHGAGCYRDGFGLTLILGYPILLFFLIGSLFVKNNSGSKIYEKGGIYVLYGKGESHYEWSDIKAYQIQYPYYTRKITFLYLLTKKLKNDGSAPTDFKTYINVKDVNEIKKLFSGKGIKEGITY